MSVINTLYYGDNLAILRHPQHYIPDASVDLIYLDPPFNSNRSYNVLFKDETGQESDAQIAIFEDTWHWNFTAERIYRELVQGDSDQVAKLIEALRSFIGTNQMMAYLVMMTVRLVELHRLLKPTGSLYLHCDPKASHYLKIILDTIFGAQHFRNEIIWKRTTAHSSAKKYAPVHDILLYYTKTNQFTWNDTRTEYDPAYLDKYYRFDDGDGRLHWRADLCAAGIRNGESGKPWRGIDVGAKGMHWKFGVSNLDKLDAEGRIYWPPRGTMPQYKRYREELKGKALADLWDDVDRINPVGGERLGYPTQKPMALLERIIAVSSNPGDVLLDPFCGCGTAIDAAQHLGRTWIGIDITHLAITLQRNRLRRFLDVSYEVVGVPKDLQGAYQLAHDDRYQFQWWALSLVGARPIGGTSMNGTGKKGTDRGIDGVVVFLDDPSAKSKRILVQVKSGGVSSRDIRDLAGTVDREKAAMGAFITLEDPKKTMLHEAASYGFYQSPWGGTHPKMQVLSVEGLLSGHERIDMPPQTQVDRTFKRAPKVPAKEAATLPLFSEVG